MPKNAKVITLNNHKGGSGKTSCCVSLAYSLSQKGYKVLAVDSDSQSNLTDNLLTMNFEDPKAKNITTDDLVKAGKTLYDALNHIEENGLQDRVYHTMYENLDLLASDSRMNLKYQELQTEMGVCHYVFKSLFNQIKEWGIYDFIIVDTRPSIGAENIQMFIASDYIIIPSTVGVRSTSGIDHVRSAIHSCNNAIKGCNIKLLGVILNQVNKRTAIARAVIPQLNHMYQGKIFETIIPIDEAVKQAEQITMPVGAYAPTSRATRYFDSFAKEVLNRIG